MVPPYSDRITRVPPYSRSPLTPFRLQGYHLLWPDFPDCSTRTLKASWASPRSLAATRGISVDFFSSGYLDVSVPRVRLLTLCIQIRILQSSGFPHSEISGSKPVYRLPEAYRRLPRPSSPPTAKASTVCAYSLDHITPNCFASTQKVSAETTSLFQLFKAI
jgi:hypothetical protein